MRKLIRKQASPFREDVEALYDTVARDWARDDAKLHDDLIGRPVIIDLAKELGAGKRVLDVGCADGFVCRLISPFAKSVIGIDISRNMLREATNRTKGLPNVSFIRGRMENIGDTVRPESIDLCLALYAVCSVKTQAALESLFHNIHRTVAPGGHLILQVPHPFDAFVREPSAWFHDSHRMMSYFDTGHFVHRKLKTVDDEWVDAARYHHTISEYINALTATGLHIVKMIEPAAPTEAVKEHSSLAREQRYPASMIVVARRPIELSDLHR